MTGDFKEYHLPCKQSKTLLGFLIFTLLFLSCGRNASIIRCWMPAWAPDGKKIAFVSFSRYMSSICMVDPQGGDFKVLIKDTNPLGDPCWSPDGQKLAFHRHQNGVQEFSTNIYVIDINTLEMKAVTNDSSWNTSPSYSPDGNEIAFSRSLNKKTYDIYVMNADGKGLRNLTDTPNISEWRPSWSPDGEKIAYEANTEKNPEALGIYIMDVKRKTIRKLTPDFLNAAHASWSPDGKKIVFSADDIREKGFKPQIYTMNADGTALKRLTTDGVNLTPVWSPDGKHIAFASIVNKKKLQIYLMDAEGKYEKDLTSNLSERLKSVLVPF